MDNYFQCIVLWKYSLCLACCLNFPALIADVNPCAPPPRRAWQQIQGKSHPSTHSHYVTEGWFLGRTKNKCHSNEPLSNKDVGRVSSQPASPLPPPVIDSIHPHKAHSLISTKCHDILNAPSLCYCFKVQPSTGRVNGNGFHTHTQMHLI